MHDVLICATSEAAQQLIAVCAVGVEIRPRSDQCTQQLDNNAVHMVHSRQTVLLHEKHVEHFNRETTLHSITNKNLPKVKIRLD